MCFLSFLSCILSKLTNFSMLYFFIVLLTFLHCSVPGICSVPNYNGKFARNGQFLTGRGILMNFCSIMSYTLLLSLIEYKTLILREDYQRAEEVLPTIPKEHMNRYNKDFSPNLMLQGAFPITSFSFIEQKIREMLKVQIHV